MGSAPVAAAGGPVMGVSPADERRKLKEVCQEFEAFLVKELLKELRESAVFGDRAGEGRPAGSDLQAGMADDRFAEWVSYSGGMGLGKMLFESLAGRMGVPDGPSD